MPVVDTSKYAEMIYYFVASSHLQQQSMFHTVFENCIFSTGVIYWNHHVYACLRVKCINALIICYVVCSLPYWSSTDLSRTQRGYLVFRIIVRVCCSCKLQLQLLENILPAVVVSKTTTGCSSYEIWDGVGREHGPSVKCVRSEVLRIEVFQSGPVAVGYYLKSVSG